MGPCDPLLSNGWGGNGTISFLCTLQTGKAGHKVVYMDKNV